MDMDAPTYLVSQLYLQGSGVTLTEPIATFNTTTLVTDQQKVVNQHHLDVMVSHIRTSYMGQALRDPLWTGESVGDFMGAPLVVLNPCANHIVQVDARINAAFCAYVRFTEDRYNPTSPEVCRAFIILQTSADCGATAYVLLCCQQERRQHVHRMCQSHQLLEHGAYEAAMRCALWKMQAKSQGCAFYAHITVDQVGHIMDENPLSAEQRMPSAKRQCLGDRLLMNQSSTYVPS